VKEHLGHRAAVLDASFALDGSVVIGAGDDAVCLVYLTEGEEEA
jgi:hypothetical protein